MTNQLWAWEYEGKTEWGFDYGSFLLTSCYSRQDSTRYKPGVTNLRKVKVVDEDAITVSRSLWLEIQEPNDGSESWQNAFRWMVRQIKYENPQLSPPITNTYLTTEQFIKVYKSLSDGKLRELDKAWYVADSAANSAANSAAYSATWYAANSVTDSAAWCVTDPAAWCVTDSAAWCAARDANLAILAKNAITKEQFNILTEPWVSCDLSLYAEDWEGVLNPKVEEPKNFGAVVEAQYYRATLRTRFFFNGVDWIRERTLENYGWLELINPIIKSEGLEG